MWTACSPLAGCGVFTFTINVVGVIGWVWQGQGGGMRTAGSATNVATVGCCLSTGQESSSTEWYFSVKISRHQYKQIFIYKVYETYKNKNLGLSIT